MAKYQMKTAPADWREDRASKNSDSPTTSSAVKGRAHPDQAREDSAADHQRHGPLFAAAGARGSQPSARSFAYAGLITSAMRANRSSNGRNADFIALTVNHSMSRTL